MTQHADEDRHQENLRRLNDALEREAISEVYALVRELHPADVALLLESLPEAERDIVWSQLDPDSVAEVLSGPDFARARRLVYGLDDAPKDFLCRACAFARHGG